MAHPGAHPEERFWSGEGSSNMLKLPREQWIENAKRIAGEAGITDPATTDEPDSTIEMETGNGKIYVYLRTIFDLN